MKFEQNASFENMVQSPRTDLLENGLPLKGNWHKEFFKNNRPIVLELGCGPASLCKQVLKLRKDLSLVGVDINEYLLTEGSKIAQNENFKSWRLEVQGLQSHGGINDGSRGSRQISFNCWVYSAFLLLKS